jgi:putative SOS response-associated peptidase YedK
MIERYSIHASAKQIATRFQIEEPEAFKPRYNAAPSQLLPVITHESPQGFSYFYWGTAPQWSKNKTIAERIINTRSELISDKPVLKKNLKTHRCLIPADGFYAWKKVGKKTTVPWRILLKSKEVFSIAGVWEEYDDHEGNSFHTFSIITVKAEKWISEITERMPVIFSRADEKIWLDQNTSEDQLSSMLKTYPFDLLEGYNVSPAINSVDKDGASMIIPTPAADQFGNLTLFD